MNFREKLLLKEYKEFLQCPSTDLPKDVSQVILQEQMDLLRPSAKKVFIKLMLIHSIFGTLSLAICNQFDLNPFHTSLSLSDYFMTFGHSFCMTLCGTVFVGGSLSAAHMILRRGELVVLKNNFLLLTLSLCLLSLATFIAVGAHITLMIGLLWIGGALIGSSIPVFAYRTIQRA